MSAIIGGRYEALSRLDSGAPCVCMVRSLVRRHQTGGDLLLRPLWPGRPWAGRARGTEAQGGRVTLTFVLPMPPNIANGSHGHWRKRYREKLEYWADLDMVLACCTTQGWAHATDYQVPRPPAQPLARATI